MKVVRVVLLCSVSCLLIMASGCAWASFRMWDYTLENQSAETLLNVKVARAGKLRPLGPGSYVFPSGAGGGDLVGVIGQMPRAVTISFTSKDRRHHRLYVAIPPRPGGYGSESPHIYFVVLARCKAIATWQDPGLWPKLYLKIRNVGGASAVTITQWFNYSSGPGGRVWRLSPAGVPARGKSTLLEPDARGAYVRVGFTNVHADRWFRISDDIPHHVEVDYTWHGRVHKVPVTLPLPRLIMRPWPRICFTINRYGQLTVRRKFQPPQRWFCAIGDTGKEKFSNITVTGNGKSYSLGNAGPKADVSLSALGPMPKAMEISFVSQDGKRHNVRVLAAAAKTFHGSKTPELYMLIGKQAKLTASWFCPSLLKYKPPPHWECGIENHSNEKLLHITCAYGGKAFTIYDELAPKYGGGTMNPEGLAPKVIDLGFTTSDGKRHTVRIVLPAFHGSGTPSFTLTIEKGGKVVATSP